MTNLLYIIYLVYVLKAVLFLTIVLGTFYLLHLFQQANMKYFKPIAITLLVCCLLFLLIPNKQTMYMMVASYTGHDIDMINQLQEMFNDTCN